MIEGFSAHARAAHLDRMGREAYDVLVIGGGIVGAGVARDAACRGLRTALVERGDFASGTSGKTSRLVHGGLRYLRSYRVGLVRQAVRERDLLMATAPSLVHPLPFVLPSYKGLGPSRTILRFGLFLYDLLSHEKVLPRRQWLAPDDATQREPHLSRSALTGAGLYHDASTDDARLVLAVVKDAANAGAVVANHAEVVDLLRTDGRVDGARIRDHVQSRTLETRATVVVNATGVWLDRLRLPRPVPTLRPTKGIHILVPRDKIGNRHALALTVRRDRRVVFVVPWNALSLVGTTDTDFAGDPDRVLPDAGDVAYLLEAVNDAFPDARVRAEDVVSAYAGLRPLLRKGRLDVSESEVSREHAIFEDPDGLISVAGGKLTTHRAMAEDVVNLATARLGRRVPSTTKTRSLGPPLHPLEEYLSLGFDEAIALRLQSRCRPEEIRRYLAEPSAGERIIADQPYVWAEVDMAVRDEMAMSLADVLVRRLGLFYESTDQGIGVASAVADRIGSFLGWGADTASREVAAYQRLVADHRDFRVDHGG